MGRLPRDQEAGIFHVTCHSVWSGPLFQEIVDYETFATMLTRIAVRRGWMLIAVVLMPNHYHLIVDVQRESLSGGMQALNYGYARCFNRRYGLRGHAFGARFDAPRVDTDAYLLAAYRYVVLNPVRAGLSERPEDWPFSSYAGTVGLGEPFIGIVDASPVLGQFGPRAEAAAARLRAYVSGEDLARVAAIARGGAR